MTNTFAIERVRSEFPALHQLVHNKPLVYFDTAVTAQKPRAVLNAMQHYYESETGNVHRGAYFLSEQATIKFSNARAKIAAFINAQPHEIIFTRSTTEAINLVAQSLGAIIFDEGDEIILTEMEHHSNIVPWYLLAQTKKLKINVAPILDDGSLDVASFRSLFTPRTKLAAFTHVSNALGTINPVKEMVAFARSHNVVTVIDGAQAAPHLKINVCDLDADFYAFSGHKMYGPTGIGVLFGKSEWLKRMPPYQGGGDMIVTVDFNHITFADAPQKFEAGTPHIAGALGLAAAVDYLDSIGFAALHAHEQSLYEYALAKIKAFPRVRLIGEANDKISIISFVIDDIHPHDISSIFDREGVAIRAGHLCAQPLMKRFGVAALCRISLSFYNTREEIDQCIAAFHRVFEVFKS